MWEDLRDDTRVHIAVGVHPKQCAEPSLAKGNAKLLRALLRQDGVLALGEVGLDNSATGDPAQLRLQARYLETLLGELRDVIVSRRGQPVPVILHYRGKPLSSQVVGQILRDLLKAQLPQSHPLQVHYFCGGPKEVAEWAGAFPNAYFSVGGAVLRQGLSGQQMAGLRAIPLDRLLLESDAPADPAPGLGFRMGTPYSIWEVTHVVAQVRSCDPEVVLVETAENAVRLFQPVLPKH
jgi:TatD DNase family protein